MAKVFEFPEAVECIRVSWSEDHPGNVSRRLDKTCDKRSLLKFFDQIKDGGKSNDVIGCVDLGLAQGVQRYPVCEKQINGSNINACPT